MSATTAFVMAAAALLVSLISLGWQVVTWRRSGPVVTVVPMLQEMAGRPETAVIKATVTNRGRAAVDVVQCYVALGKGPDGVASLLMPMHPTERRRLEAHASFDDYQFPAAGVREVLEQDWYRDCWVHVAAGLGTGATVYSEKPVPRFGSDRTMPS